MHYLVKEKLLVVVHIYIYTLATHLPVHYTLTGTGYNMHLPTVCVVTCAIYALYPILAGLHMQLPTHYVLITHY